MPKRKRSKENPEKWLGKPVAVLWKDASFNNDEHAPMPEPEIGITFGLLETYNEEKVRVIGEFFTDGAKRQKTAVPYPMVMEVIPWRSFEFPDAFQKEFVARKMGGGRSVHTVYEFTR